ncbi:MAG: glycosyltransferase family 4 protein [Bacteroidota bacterium]
MTESTRAVLLVGNFLSESMVYGSVGEDLSRRLTARGWSVVMTSGKMNRALRLIDMVRTVLSRRRDYAVAHVDVFSGVAFLWAEAACRALRLVRKPYALTLRGGDLPNFAARQPKRVRQLLASAEVVTSPSGYLRERMRPYREDIRLLTNPLETGCYPRTVRKSPAPRLVWLRAFHEIYNPSLVPAVMAELSDIDDIHTIMVGPDKGDGSLQRARRRAEELGVAQRIAFPGPVPKKDVPQWLNRGDIFINTASIDNTPTSVLEAMACGLCVVSTNVGGIPYLLEDERDALLVPPGDAPALAAAVRRVLREPGLAERLSTQGRRKVEEFDWSHLLPQWEELFLELARRGGQVTKHKHTV